MVVAELSWRVQGAVGGVGLGCQDNYPQIPCYDFILGQSARAITPPSSRVRAY